LNLELSAPGGFEIAILILEACVLFLFLIRGIKKQFQFLIQHVIDLLPE
jgi:hypothetical protein